MGFWDFFRGQSGQHDRSPEELAALMASYQRTCWAPQTNTAPTAAVASKFGGAGCLIDQEPAPVCGHCEEPLQLFLQLHSGDLPADAGKPWGDGLFQFFSCTRPGKRPIRDLLHLTVPFLEQALLRVIDATRLQSATSAPVRDDDFPELIITGWQPQIDAPEGEALVEAGESLTEGELDWFYDHEQRVGVDKLFGFPRWVQEPDIPTCESCGESMDFFFQIEAFEHLPFNFGDGGRCYLFYCPSHEKNVAMIWQTT